MSGTLTYREVGKLTGLSRSTITRRVRAGEFPAPVNLGSQRRVAFIADEVDAWLANRPRVVYRREAAA